MAPTNMTRVLPPGSDAGSAKSGYARDIAPGSLSLEEISNQTVAVASGKGKQEGRVAPALRKTPKYEALTAEEADERLRKRLAGELDTIKGGLDDPMGAAEITQYEDARMEVADAADRVAPGIPHQNAGPNPPAVIPGVEGISADQLDYAIAQLQSQRAQVPVGTPSVPKSTYIPIPPTFTPEQVQDSWVTPPSVPHEVKHVTSRITMAMKGAGTYAIPAIAVVEAGMGILVILPAGDNDAIFTPTPGTEVDVTFKGTKYECYFPGVSGIVETFGVVVMAMLSKDIKE